LELERRRTRREAEQARLNAEVAALRHRNALARSMQADSEVAIERALFQTGEGRLIDLLERQTALVEARLAVIRARGDLVRRRIDYLTAIGVDAHDWLRGRAARGIRP